ncbi:MAG: hypothetical protein UW95_C0007G0040 [Parcubacteria group bacterium GW2011_GWC1_45_14]|nr:MAG: hypothetical protein UW95_C0007G0040 [Parcubacteria group bacterium GW2011_GWC1_45_14]
MEKREECILLKQGCPFGDVDCTGEKFAYCERRKLVQKGFGTLEAKLEIASAIKAA